MAGEMIRASMEIAADVAIMQAKLVQELINDYSIAPETYDFNLDELEDMLQRGDRDALVDAIPALIAQMFQQQPEEPPVG